MAKRYFKYWGIILLLILNYNVQSQSINNDSTLFESPINIGKNKIINFTGLDKSFQKLKSIKEGSNKQFVIVHFGDSHIQMGHFSGTIKKNLQTIFGDCGEGILFPYSACKSFGPTNLISKFSGNWIWNNLLVNPERTALGITGYCIKTNDTNASFDFAYSQCPYCDSPINIGKIKIFHGINNFGIVSQNDIIDDGYTELDKNSSWEITTITPKTRSSNFTFNFIKTKESQKEFVLYGILFENSQKTGIQYHHFGVVGAQFLEIVKVAPLLIPQLESLKPDLIIFSYGSNESYNPTFDSISYFKEIANFIKKIRVELPNVEFIITSAPDTRSNNVYPTYTKSINNTFRMIAKNTNSAYWDLNAIMGGDGSMESWYKNGLSKKDKLHFIKSGYMLQGNLFSLAFFNAYNEKYPKSIKTTPFNFGN